MLLLVAVFGCGPDHPGPAPTYVFVIDYSASTEANRKQQLGQMITELESVPDDTNVVIYRMGSETEEVFAGSLSDAGTDAVVGVLKRTLLTSDSVKGTNFAKMAAALANFARRFKGQTYKIRVMTDGGNDFKDANSLRAYRQAAMMVSMDRRLSSLVFCGIQPEFRQTIRSVFAAASDRLEILGQDQTFSE